MNTSQDNIQKIYEELQELDPDFSHDSASLKKMISAMMEIQPKVLEDKDFKEQLKNNLLRHIHWNKENLYTQQKNDRIGRIIAYGIPGLAFGFGIFVLFPFIQEKNKFSDSVSIEPVVQEKIVIQDLSTASSVGDSVIIEEKSLESVNTEENIFLEESTIQVQNTDENIVVPVEDDSGTISKSSESEEYKQEKKGNLVEEGESDLFIQADTISAPGSHSTEGQANMMMSTSSLSQEQDSVSADSLSLQDNTKKNDKLQRGTWLGRLGDILLLDTEIRFGETLSCRQNNEEIICILSVDFEFSYENKKLLLQEVKRVVKGFELSDDQEDSFFE